MFRIQSGVFSFKMSALHIYNPLSPVLTLLPLQMFECQIPQPLGLLEAFVAEDEEYPIVVFGIKERSASSMWDETARGRGNCLHTYIHTSKCVEQTISKDGTCSQLFRATCTCSWTSPALSMYLYIPTCIYIVALPWPALYMHAYVYLRVGPVISICVYMRVCMFRIQSGVFPWADICSTCT